MRLVRNTWITALGLFLLLCTLPAFSAPNESTLPEPPGATHTEQKEPAANPGRTIGWALLGANGEILSLGCSPETVTSTALYVASTGTGLEIIPRYPLGPPYAVVDENGKLTLRAEPPSGVYDTSQFAKWPRKYRKGSFTMPPKGTLLWPSGGNLKAKLVRPANCIGWMFLTKDGEFVGLPKGTKPFCNVLWVVRRGDGGLDFVHSGPAKTGTYMTVSKDRKVRYFGTIPPAENTECEEVWPFLDEKRLPTIAQGEFCIPAHPTAFETEVIHQDGTTHIEIRPIP